MLKKFKAAADARVEAGKAALGGFEEKAKQLVSPETAGLIAAAIAQQAAADGLLCDLEVEVGAGTVVGELAMGFTLDPSDLTPDAAAELQRRKPPAPPGIAPLLNRLEASVSALMSDLARRLDEMKDGLVIFRSVQVSGTAQIDAQFASVWLTVTASQERE